MRDKNNKKTFTDFKIRAPIGKGAYGKIYSALYKKLEVCLKIININSMKRNYEEKKLGNYENDLDNEIRIMSLLSKYSNSVKYYNSFDRTNEYGEKEKVIIMEKCDKDLETFIKEKKSPLKICEIKKKFEGLNEVFQAMQDKKIIHRNLKVGNLLVKKNGDDYIIKLSDYGISKFQNNNKLTAYKGTKETMAPEIMLNEKNEKYDNSLVDIFSLGIILFQIASPLENGELKHPFYSPYTDLYITYKNNYDNELYDDIDFDDSLNDNSETYKNFENLVKRMTKLNPKNRITWKEYFNHPFFK